MRPLLLLAFAWVLLFPVPALAQPSQDDTTAASPQYDQYAGQEPGTGGWTAHDAIHDALVASGAIRSSSEEAQATEGDDASAATLSNDSSEPEAAPGEGQDAENSAETQDESASAAETQGDSATTSSLEKLPQTGGFSLLWSGVLLACAAGLLARRALRP